MLRVLDRLDDDETGFSLVELLVVMTLLAIVSVIVVGGITTMFRQTVHAEERITAVTNMQNVAANLTREIRAADSYGSATNPTGPNAALRVTTPNRIEFDVMRDLGLATDPAANGISRIRFVLRVDAANATLVEERRVWVNRTANPATNPANQTSTRVIMRNLAETTEIFRYFTAQSAPVDVTAVGFAGQSTIAEVELYLSRAIGGGRNPIDVEAKVRLRNAP